MQVLTDFTKETNSKILVTYNYVSQAKQLESAMQLLKDTGVWDKLNSQAFIDFLDQKLAPALSNPFITQTRIPLRQLEGRIVKDGADIEYAEYSPLGQVPGETIAFEHDGVIAGGSIGALINEFVHGVPAVINDIDYFYYDHTKTETQSNLEYELYEWAGDLDDFNYMIKKSTRDGDFNYSSLYVGKDFNWRNLLESFDINSCCFAYHPISKKLIYHPLALIFLAFRELKLLNVRNRREYHDVFSYIIRGKRKSEELQAKFYWQDEFKAFIFSNAEFSKFLSEGSFGVNTKKKYFIKAPNSFKARGIFFIPNKDLKVLEKNPTFLYPLFNYNEKQQKLEFISDSNHYSFFFKWYLFLKQYNEHNNFKWMMSSISKGYPITEPTQSVLARLDDFLSSAIIVNASSPTTFWNQAFKYLSSFQSLLFMDYSFKDKSQLMAFVQEHSEFLSLINTDSFSTWSFDEKINFLLKVSKEPLHIIGAFEKILKRNTNLNIIKNLLSLKKVDDILAFVNKEYLKDLKQDFLKDKENLGVFSRYITELTNTSELQIEGQKMRHCVGGYSSAIKNGTSRIFHININKKESTLEVGIQYSEKRRHQPQSITYIVRQHKSYCNGNPEILSRNLAKYFVHCLNKK